MRARQVFEYALVELNKRKAPSLLLEDYNYFINKAVNQYINRMYNAYEVNQQKTDDIRVLKSSAILIPSISPEWSTSNLLDTTYEVDLPDDYLHILNCVVEYTVKQNYKCYSANTKWQQGARRVTADMWPQILHNHYFKPSYKIPYFYINNVNISNVYPTSDNQVDILFNVNDATPYDEANTYAKEDIVYVQESAPSVVRHYYRAIIDVPINTFPGSYLVSGETEETRFSTTHWTYLGTGPSGVRTSPNRYGNKSKVRMEVRYGKDNTTFELSKIYIDYIKTPQFISLSQDEIDEMEDNSQILEFPDYVCQEIVNELVKLLMENGSDPRLQSHIPINQSISMPGQEQQKNR